MLVLPAAAQIPAYVSTDGLVGWWPFNGNANDESGNGNNGTVNGATLTEDRFGNAEAAYSFNGSSTINVLTSSQLSTSNTNEMTVAVWAYKTDGLTRGHILGKRINCVNQIDFQIGYCVSGVCGCGTCVEGLGFGGTSTYVYNETFFSANSWHLVTGTLRDNVWKIYIDGVLSNSVEGAANNPSNSADLIFGGSGQCDRWNGLIDDIAIWNRALTQEEITALYTGEPVSPPAACNPLPSNLQQGLVGYWPFCGNANDESGNGNDGTVNGATLTEDRFGNAESAYELTEYSNNIIFTNNPQFDFSEANDLTLSYWLKRTSGNIYSLYKYDNGYPDNSDFAISAGPETSLNLIGDGTNSIPFEVNGDEWEQVTAIFSRDSNQTKLYVNGLLVLQGTLNYNQSSSSSPFAVNFAAGIQNYTTGLGKIDDIAIWNRALTPEEITALYTGEPVSPPTACNPLPANLQQGLVGYWPFCGNANDESGNGNDGTVNGATLTEDRFGNAAAAYSFDGNDDINFGMNDEFGVITGVQRTFSLWVNSVSGGNVLSKYEDYSPNNSNFLLAFNLSDSALRLIGNGTNFIDFDPLSIGNWYHVVGVYDGINNLNQLFINGELVAFGSLNFSNSVSTQPMYAGRVGGEPFYYTGLIDDISFWNRSLTADEVQQLYTLNACTIAVYDTSHVTVYDTLTTYATVYDTLYTYETIYDTLTTENIVNVYDTTLVENVITTYDTITTENIVNVYDTTLVENVITTYDTITTENIVNVYDTTLVENVITTYDTITTENIVNVYDTTLVENVITTYDTLTTENIVNVYDTVTTYVTVTDTLLIDITFTGIEGQPSWLNTVTVFPNPASDHITIDYGNFALMAGYNTIITDAAGATVYSSAINSQQAYIDINAWGAAGVYYLTIYDTSGAPVAVRHIVLE